MTLYDPLGHSEWRAFQCSEAMERCRHHLAEEIVDSKPPQSESRVATTERPNEKIMAGPAMG